MTTLIYRWPITDPDHTSMGQLKAEAVDDLHQLMHQQQLIGTTADITWSITHGRPAHLEARLPVRPTHTTRLPLVPTVEAFDRHYHAVVHNSPGEETPVAAHEH